MYENWFENKIKKELFKLTCINKHSAIVKANFLILIVIDRLWKRSVNENKNEKILKKN